MAQVLSRIAAAAQAWQQTGQGGTQKRKPALGQSAQSGTEQAATGSQPQSAAIVRDAQGRVVSVGGFPAPPPGANPDDFRLTPQQLQDYYNSTVITRGGVTGTIADLRNRANTIYDAIDPTPRIGDDGYTPRDFLDDVKRDNQDADVLQAAARSNKRRRTDPQVAIAEDEAGRGRRRRTLAALGTRKSSAGSGVLGGGGQPGQAVRPGRTSAASVLG